MVLQTKQKQVIFKPTDVCEMLSKELLAESARSVCGVCVCGVWCAGVCVCVWCVCGVNRMQPSVKPCQ